MKEYLEDFKQKREENKLSYSAYYNLLNTNRNISYDFSNKSGLISIIVATHNRVDQLSQLINSILKQTYQNFEIILIDDTSTDETNEIFGNFFDKRLKYYRNYENMGMGLNRQKAYNLSKGDYVIFCDDDDYFIDNTYFSDVVKIFKEYEDVNVICSECYTHYEKEDKYVPLILNLDEGTIDSIEYMENFMIKYKKPIVFPAFRRKNMIEAQFKEMTMMNDTSLYLRAFMTGGKAYINKKIIGIYRMHGENDTFTTKSDFIIKNLEEKRKIYEYVKEHKIIQNVDYWYAKQIAVTVNHYLRHVGDEEGIDNVLNWVWKNVSYDEYLKYKKTVLESYNLKLYYYKYPNVGDMLNEVIFSKLFNLNLEEDNFQTADLCAIGSILDKIFTNSHLNDDEIKMQNECTGNKPLHIWGTGLMYEYENINQKSIRPLIIHALRGENTRKRVSEIMGKEIECVLADPGLLAPLIVEAREKEWEVGIIPHYTPPFPVFPSFFGILATKNLAI